MTDRRFNEDEVAAIFAKATEAQQTRQRQLPQGEGMTLAELQEIGREVGIAPELVAQAATSLGQLGSPTARRFLGFPIGVGRTVDLGRKLSEEDWERLVVDLRETFDARGVVKQEGAFRQWTNGNLQALLEPTPTGHRLRLRTFKSDARGWMIAGLALTGVTAVSLIAGISGGAPGNQLTSALEYVAIGVGLFAIGAVRLPGWARRRQQQMEEIAGRLARD